MILDAQCHLGQGCRYKVSSAALLGLMDKNQVERAIIVPVDQFVAVYNREGNDFILREARSHSDRFLPMITANPWYGSKAVDEARRGFEQGAVGLKLHPGLQGFQITDAIVHPLVELAGECGRPVYFHTGTPVTSMPLQLTELAQQFPGTNFIMGHMGFSDFWNDVVNATKGAPNIYLETSGHWPSFIVEMVGLFGANRILYGSDTPMNLMAIEIEKITRHVSKPEDVQAILHVTAEKLFGISAPRSTAPAKGGITYAR
ncbi:MAG TPA: amidohydrolase family protein [Clostridia bacterium]|nr:amidohydrolase family protein [Clostridia bacterium]